MGSGVELNSGLLVQPLALGTIIPNYLEERGLFLLNFESVLRDDVWDDYGHKELDQSRRLRGLAFRIMAIADAMEQLGCELKAYPDLDDYDMGDYEQTWEEICQEMESTFDGGYSHLANLVEELKEAAVRDFMD